MRLLGKNIFKILLNYGLQWQGMALSKRSTGLGAFLYLKVERLSKLILHYKLDEVQGPKINPCKSIFFLFLAFVHFNCISSQNCIYLKKYNNIVIRNFALLHRSVINLFLWENISYISNKSPTRRNNFPVYYPDVYLQLNMFRGVNRPDHEHSTAVNTIRR
jgi:hypothetical protein